MEFKIPTGIKIRKPYDSELNYFKKNIEVAGMATDDNMVILNPYSKLNKQEKQAVVYNESARIVMRTDMTPNFALTDEQTKFLDSNSYRDAGDVDRKATIAARLLSGDPSAGTPTQEQSAFVNELKLKMGIE